MARDSPISRHILRNLARGTAFAQHAGTWASGKDEHMRRAAHAHQPTRDSLCHAPERAAGIARFIPPEPRLRWRGPVAGGVVSGSISA